MEDWIFQANLKRYDVHAEVTQLRTWWNTPHHRAEIAINDRVLAPDCRAIYSRPSLRGDSREPRI